MALILGGMMQQQCLLRQRRSLAQPSTPPSNQRLTDEAPRCPSVVVDLAVYGERLLA
jgi:hypothetical protein